MTEIEKIAYAKGFLDALAEGINPLDGTALPEGDIVNNVRISRCLFFVSDVLRQVIENGGTERTSKPKKRKFSADDLAALERFEYSDSPIYVSDIATRIKNLFVGEEITVPRKQITKWLTANGAITETSEGFTKPTKVPTAFGKEIGLVAGTRTSAYGDTYGTIKYSRRAQEFIIDNFEAILDA